MIEVGDDLDRDASLKEKIENLVARQYYEDLYETIVSNKLDEDQVDSIGLEAGLGFLCKGIGQLTAEERSMMGDNHLPLSSAIMVVSLPPGFRKDAIRRLKEHLGKERTSSQILKEMFEEREVELQDRFFKAMSPDMFDHLIGISEGRVRGLIGNLKNLKTKNQMNKMTVSQKNYFVDSIRELIKGEKIPHEKGCVICKKIVSIANDWITVCKILREWS